MKLVSDNELTHYGVLGMKWGKRKGVTTSSKTSKGSSKKTSSRRMSNKELQSRIKRLKMEKEYRDLQKNLSPKSKFTLDEAAKMAGKIVLVTKTATTMYKGAEKFAKSKTAQSIYDGIEAIVKAKR